MARTKQIASQLHRRPGTASSWPQKPPENPVPTTDGVKKSHRFGFGSIIRRIKLKKKERHTVKIPTHFATTLQPLPIKIGRPFLQWRKSWFDILSFSLS
ncbi:hypothetical protein OROHE_023290 [Orobanche hederae]